MTTVTDYEKLLNWLANSDTGMSSEYIAYTLAGVKREPWDGGVPCDDGDLRRCLKLNNLMGWHERFKAEFAGPGHNHYWNALVACWDELASLSEKGDAAGVYERITQAIDTANRIKCEVPS